MPSSVGALSYIRDGEPKPASTVARVTSCAAVERLAQRRSALGRLILARRHAHDAFEQTLQVKRADVHGVAQLREREPLLRVGVERSAGAIDDLEFARQAAGLAAFAIAIARGAGGVCRSEEIDVFTARLARCARWTAEHAGGFDAVEKCAIGVRVALGQGFPAFGVCRPGRCHGTVHDVPEKTVSMVTNVVCMPTHYAPVLALSLRGPCGDGGLGANCEGQFKPGCDKTPPYRVFP